MSQIKLHVLAIGAIDTGLSRSGQPWFRRSLQCFTGDVVGQIPYYAPKDELEIMQAGYYMAELQGRAGDRGRLEYVLGKLTPATPTQAKPSNT